MFEGHRATVTLLFMLTLLVLLSAACTMVYRHSATARANGLTRMHLEAALPSERGWSTRTPGGAVYRERSLNRRVLAAVSLHVGEPEVRVKVYGGRPADKKESAAWRFEVDDIVARIDAVHPAVGAWTHEDHTSGTLLSVAFAVLAVCGAIVIVLLELRRRREVRAFAEFAARSSGDLPGSPG